MSKKATTAISKPPEPVAMTPFTLHGIEQAEQLADRLARSGLVPSALRGKPDDILVVLMSGHELGIGPMRSLQDLYVIDGKVVMAADLAVALVLRNPEVCDYFRCVETTKTQAVYETHRAGSTDQPVRMAWTIQQAQVAGLLNKDNWKRYPEAMLRHRCAMSLARSEYPDLVRNIYDPDEADEFINITPTSPIPPPKVIPMQPRIIQEPASRTTIEQPKAPEPPPAAPAPTQAQTPAAQAAPKPGDFSEPVAQKVVDSTGASAPLEDMNAIFKRIREVCERLNWKPENTDKLLASLLTIEAAKDCLFRAEAKLKEVVASRPDGGQETGPDAKGADSAG